MLEEEIKKADSNRKRYVYLNKFNEYKEETDRRFKYIDKEIEGIFDRLVGFTIILSVLSLGAIVYCMFK